MLDRNKIGYEFERFSVDVEKGRIRMFSNAIGENNPIYTSEKSAIEAGYETIPAPPTFLFVLDMETKDILPVVNLLNIDIGKILHGSQEFDYFHMIYVKDVITVTSKIIDIFDKKDGALEFVVIENSYTNQHNVLVANSKNTLVYRSGV